MFLFINSELLTKYQYDSVKKRVPFIFLNLTESML